MTRHPEAKHGDHGGSRHRSPNYPAVGLLEAVQRVKALISKDGKAGAPIEAAAKHIGFSGAHGTARAVLSALKKFGLIADQRGRIVPTQLAMDITSFPESHERSVAARQTAALSPVVYKHLIDRYGNMGNLPSDESMRAELVADMGFNPKAVDAFVNDFVSSLQYAGLIDANRLLLSNGGSGTQAEPLENELSASMSGFLSQSQSPVYQRVAANMDAAPPQGKQMRDLTLPLMDNELAILRVPAQLSEENYEYLVQQISVLKRGLVAKKSPPEGAQPPVGDRWIAQPAESNVARVPVMITHDMRHKLLAAGFTPAQIADMTPQEAWVSIEKSGL
jgi:hypothetical protein